MTGQNDSKNWLQVFADSFLDIKKGMDREGTIIYIRNNRSMYGANAWYLIASIIIASVGLNLNSAAVIIGGMLISPLMSPILGVGLGIAINDRDLLLNSVYHFALSVIITLVGSYIYFSLTPIQEMTAEIQGRISPTLLDTLVAFFGGLAGIISISRKEVSNALPGVAIATALMPPLCVTGYGLAEGNFAIFINSFYLFFINSFFIAISTFIISRILQFPLREYQDAKERRRTSLAITIASLILILPSVYIFYGVYSQARAKQQIQSEYINKYFSPQDNPQAIEWKYLVKENQLVLQLYGNHLSEEQRNTYKEKLKALINEDIRILFIQDAKIDVNKIAELENQISSVKNMTENIQETENERSELIKQNEQLRKKLDSISNFTIVNQLLDEVQLIQPKLEGAHLYKKYYNFGRDSSYQIHAIKLQWAKDFSDDEKVSNAARIRDWFEQKLNIDTLIVTEE